MYYEETVINGVLHFRISPKGVFEPYSSESLTNLIVELRKRERELIEELDRLEALSIEMGEQD